MIVLKKGRQTATPPLRFWKSNWKTWKPISLLRPFRNWQPLSRRILFMRCTRNTWSSFLTSAIGASLGTCTRRLWNILRNIICSASLAHRSFPWIQAGQKTRNSLLRRRHLETSFTAILLWTPSMTRMYSRSGWITSRQWRRRKRLRMRWSGILTGRRPWWLLSVSALWPAIF